nr:MAG TPA: hypothetical protein [Caudoviricetes sp.]
MVDETYSFTKEELDELGSFFRVHVANANDDGNSGRYKCPKHWMKFVIFAPPRAGILYKGFVCNCGFEFYLRKKKEGE